MFRIVSFMLVATFILSSCSQISNGLASAFVPARALSPSLKENAQKIDGYLRASEKFGDFRDSVAFDSSESIEIMDRFTTNGFSRSEILDRASWSKWDAAKVKKFTEIVKDYMKEITQEAELNHQQAFTRIDVTTEEAVLKANK